MDSKSLPDIINNTLVPNERKILIFRKIISIRRKYRRLKRYHEVEEYFLRTKSRSHNRKKKSDTFYNIKLIIYTTKIPQKS